MVSERKLALSRIRHQKSRTLLTVIAILLMTVLLMGLGTTVMGLMDLNRREAMAENNVHAVFRDLNNQQIAVLKNHKDVEALETDEFFATVEYGKINGYLTFAQSLKDGIYHGTGNLIEGRAPQSDNEISASKAFFERIGVEPSVGNRFTLSFRPGGEGLIQTREFVICGILSGMDYSELDVSDAHIAYSAEISESLIREYFSEDQRSYYANLRVNGEKDLNYDEIRDVIGQIASDIGCDENNITYNNHYLYVMTDPGSEMTAIVAFITLLIVLFSGLVIYSIYYVSVITDVREIGKLKALGSTGKQIRKMLLTEGIIVSAFALPPGMLIGYLIPRIFLPLIFEKLSDSFSPDVSVEHLQMLSPVVILLVIAAVLLTVVISLLRPMQMASKISPIEAIRYQESKVPLKTKGSQKHRPVTLWRLTAANLRRNKKRTVVTMVTMGLSCVLFLSFAAMLNSARAEDIARREVPEGDFRLYIDCNWNDKEYPETNLDRIQQNNPLSDELMTELKAVPGVEKITVCESVLVGSDFSSELFEDGKRVDLSCFSKEDAKDYEKEIQRGALDYDAMTAENGAIFTSDIFLDQYGLKIGDTLDLVVYDGDRRIPLTIKVTGSVDAGGSSYFLVPEEVFRNLGLESNAATDFNIYVSEPQYDGLKSYLTEITAENEFFALYSLDEEMKIGQTAVNIIKYPMYLILGMVAIISFMNLINTMITSIITRKREIGVLQAIGLSNLQLRKMLDCEGMIFTVGSLIAALTAGNFFGYMLFLWAKSSHMMSISQYHYPLWETVGLVAVFIIGQIVCSRLIQRRIRRESLIDRIRHGE